MKSFSIIVAQTKNGIGLNNKIPLATQKIYVGLDILFENNIVVMGRKRKVYEPLKNRINIILSRNK